MGLHKFADEVREFDGVVDAHALDEERLTVEELSVFAELFGIAGRAEGLEL